MDHLSDAELVERAAGGDLESFGRIYDRYAARVHDLCLHLLRNPEDAADATAEVFLSAASHLDGLRDPDRLRPWLYAIARNEIYRRSRRRGREVAMSEQLDDLVEPADGSEGTPAADPERVARFLREAAAGLDERDRLVMELTLAGGIDGRELAEALGVDVGTAHQAAHRMRERLGRSAGALLVARQGRGDCDELAKLLDRWDGTFSVLWRKRVARHVDQCETCERRRRRVPAAVIDDLASAETAPIRFVEPPAWVRGRVFEQVRLGGGAPGWGGDGFPPVAGRGGGLRRRTVVALGVLVVLLGGVGVGVAIRPQQRREVVVGDSTTSAPARRTAGAPTSVTTTGDTPTSESPGAPGDLGVTTSSAGVTSTVRSGSIPTNPIRSSSTTAPRRTSSVPTNPSTTVADTIPPAPTMDLKVPQFVEPGPCPPNNEIVASTSVGIVEVSMIWELTGDKGITSGTIGFKPVSEMVWTALWQPTATGTYVIVATATDEQGRTVSAKRSGVVEAC